MLTYGVHFIYFHFNRFDTTHSLQKLCLMLWGLTFPVIHYLFILVMNILLIALSLLIWLVHLFGAYFFFLQTTIFLLFALGGRFLFWHLMFFFVYILFTSQIFRQFYCLKKGKSHRQFYQYLYLEVLLSFYWWSPLYYDFVISWLSCNKWQFALTVFFVFLITTQAVT